MYSNPEICEFIALANKMGVNSAKKAYAKESLPIIDVSSKSGQTLEASFRNRVNATYQGKQHQLKFLFAIEFGVNSTKLKHLQTVYFIDGNRSVEAYGNVFPDVIVQDALEIARKHLQLAIDLKVAELSFLQAYPDKELKKFSYNSRTDQFYFTSISDGKTSVEVYKRADWFELIKKLALEEKTTSFFIFQGLAIGVYLNTRCVAKLLSVPSFLDDRYVAIPMLQDSEFNFASSDTAIGYFNAFKANAQSFEPKDIYYFSPVKTATKSKKTAKKQKAIGFA